jgi:cell division protein FtsI/penicillin-binding protein 2
LTIDARLQYIAERELARGATEHRADGGTAIIMDPRTGEVLAMANYPPVNPNFYQEFPLEQWMNRAVQGIYEPGSTFKVVTASAAMEEHVFSPTDLVDASAGVWRSGSRRVTEAKNHNYGVLSSQRAGQVEQRRRDQDRPRRRDRPAGVRRFGLAMPAGRPGETRGML